MIKESQYIQFLSYGPKILLAVIIPVFDDLYHKVAVWLNDMGELSVSVLLLTMTRLDYSSDSKCLLKVQFRLMWLPVTTATVSNY